MQLLDPSSKARPQVAQDSSPRLPSDLAIRGALEGRGVRLEPEDGEELDIFEARLETALMAHFRDNRSEESFAALYAYAAPALLTSIARSLGSQGARLDPQEILQDVFVNIYRYAAGFRDEQPRSFRVWAGAIARNAARRKHSLRSRLSIHDLPDGVAEPVDPRRGPALSLTCEEERRTITGAWSLVMLYYLAAYEELSPRDRMALDLIEVQGLSYAEGCERLKVGMSNMKMIMFRARKRIRARIAQAMDDSLPAELRQRQAG